MNTFPIISIRKKLISIYFNPIYITYATTELVFSPDLMWVLIYQGSCDNNNGIIKSINRSHYKRTMELESFRIPKFMAFCGKMKEQECSSISAN